MNEQIILHLRRDTETYIPPSVLGSPRAHLHVVGMLRFMSEIKQPSLPTPFHSVFASISVLWPFQLYFIPSILPTTLLFVTMFSRSYLCLIGPFNFMSLYESLLQPRYIIPSG